MVTLATAVKVANISGSLLQKLMHSDGFGELASRAMQDDAGGNVFTRAGLRLQRTPGKAYNL